MKRVLFLLSAMLLTAGCSGTKINAGQVGISVFVFMMAIIVWIFIMLAKRR